MAIITTFPIAAETAGGPAAFEQITLFDVIADLNPWNYMRAMFEPAPLMIAEDLHKTARMHLILCTQVATQDVIPACIRDNMANIVCLRQRDAGKYRYLLGCFPGRLPQFGKCYLFTPEMFDRPEKVETTQVWNRIARR